MKINHPLTSTTIATATTVNLFEKSDLTDGRLPSFTFEKQKKFKYIDIISDHINANIPKFIEIWPLLGAYTTNNSWDLSLDEDLEFIGVAHYTILKSLSYIYQNKDFVEMNDPQQRFKNIIFHYALIIDCIKQISFHIVRFKCKLNPKSYNVINKKTKSSFMKKMEEWYDKKYETRFENFQKNGGIIMLDILSTKKHISMLNTNDSFSTYFDFDKIINPYRNVFVHNPSIDLFRRGKKLFVVKSEFIKTNKTIQSISKLKISDMIDPLELMADLFTKATLMLADVWIVFYNEIEAINTDPGFLIKRYVTD
jgi:hypothetical protein